MDELNPVDSSWSIRPAKFSVSQPFSVAEVFTGTPGKQVPVADTVRGFKEILEGKHDDVAEQDFYMKGGIEDIHETSAAEKGKPEAPKAGKPTEEKKGK
jgi:F-type H+-transporting ATPase subunit beta